MALQDQREKGSHKSELVCAWGSARAALANQQYIKALHYITSHHKLN
jgi:hypothetical protein